MRNSGPRALVLEFKGTEGNTNVTHFSPIFTPGVANNPVVLGTFYSPSDDRDDMVNRSTTLSSNTSLVLKDRGRVDTTADRSTSIDLFLHACGAGDKAIESTILVNGGVGELAKFLTEAAVVGEGRASSGNATNLTGGVDVFAEAFGGLAAAGEVRIGSLVRDSSASFGDRMEPLIDTRDRATVARTDVSAVENMLNTQVDVSSFGFTGNFDTVSKGRDGSMSPAGTTILRNVLVAIHGAVVDTVLVTPRELSGQVFITDIVLRKRFMVVVVNNPGIHLLLNSPDFTGPAASVHSAKGKKG